MAMRSYRAKGLRVAMTPDELVILIIEADDGDVLEITLSRPAHVQMLRDSFDAYAPPLWEEEE